MTTDAQAILERRRHEGEVLLAAQRERERESRRDWQAYTRTLPRLAYVPADVEPGVKYVLCTEPEIMAFDGRRVFKAAVRGDWVEESRARTLGLDGPAVMLVDGRAEAAGRRR